MSEQSPARGHHTALHRAAMVGHSEALAALIQGGCAVDLQDREGNTALHEVSWHGFSHCVKLLVKATSDVNIRNKAGNTALHLACQNAHAAAARLLLLGGATSNTQNNVRDTCLHVAARYNNVALVEILLTSLCSVSETNQGGDTALHVAAALNHKKTVQLLLQAGTDGNIRNNAGKTALDKARDNNHKEVALLLARAPQIHCFLRGKTIRKRRAKLRAERRTQSATREDILPDKACSYPIGESTSSEQMQIGTAVKADPHPQTQARNSPHRHHKRGRRVMLQALNEDDLRKDKHHCHIEKGLHFDEDEDNTAQNGKTYQLYTLYRDKDGHIRQAPANGCHCAPKVKKLEGQLKATQEEMRLRIHNVQEQVNNRLGQMDCRNRHQIKELDMLNQDRAAAEKKNMMSRMEQRLAQRQEESLLTQQAAVSEELERWCVSQLKGMDRPAKAQYYKLLPSPSVELETFPLLPVLSGDSSTSLAPYVSLLPDTSTHSLAGPEQEHSMGNGTYFEMKVDTSPDDCENMVQFPLPVTHPSGVLKGLVAPLWQPVAVHDGPRAVSLCGDGGSSSSSQSSISDQQHTHIQQQDHSANRQYRAHYAELRRDPKHAGILAQGSSTVEFFNEQPTEAAFSQERNYLHARQATVRFFDTVSLQLEHWYQRKMEEVEQQTQSTLQQDREELLHRISLLEAELTRLSTNHNAEHS